MERSGKFYVPAADYFTSGNVITGSLGNFNYKISPDLEQEELEVVTWLGKMNLAHSEVQAQQRFELSEEGLQQLDRWLGEQL